LISKAFSFKLFVLPAHGRVFPLQQKVTAFKPGFCGTAHDHPAQERCHGKWRKSFIKPARYGKY